MEDFFDDFPAQSANPVIVEPQFDRQGPIAWMQAPQDQAVLELEAPVQISAEQQERKDKLRVIEEERIKSVRQRDDQERVEKNQRKEKARLFLEQFKRYCEDYSRDLAAQLENKKTINRQQQEILQEAKKNHQEYKNSWDKIASNINLKDGEIKGQKDVSKMRQAILNKRNDLSK